MHILHIYATEAVEMCSWQHYKAILVGARSRDLDLHNLGTFEIHVVNM